jgi:hypothetical protein
MFDARVSDGMMERPRGSIIFPRTTYMIIFIT